MNAIPSARRPRRPRRRTAVTSTALALLATLAVGTFLAGCSGSASSPMSSIAGSDASRGGISDSVAGVPEIAESIGKDGAAVSPADFELPGRSVISKGAVSLRSDDVTDARFEVQKVIDRYDGEITDEQANSGKDGELSTVHLVVRVPSDDFSAALASLEKAGKLDYSRSSSEDVTTQVIDVEVRISAQRRSITRIETLLDRARNLRDIVLIEGELTRRQAELDSLEQQSAYLADQTSLSTITVNLERTAEKKKTSDDSGFLAGLSAGWHHLVDVTVSLATLVGAVLPFAVVLLVLALAGWPVLRRLRPIRHQGPLQGQAQPVASE